MARPPKTQPSPESITGKPGLPEPTAILERESRQIRTAIYASILVALLTAAAVIVENLMANSVPDIARTTLIDTLGAATNGTAAPPSYYSSVGEWKLDHTLGTTAAAFLRGFAYIAMFPLSLLLLRGARERGGQLGRFLEPLLIIGLFLLAVGPIAIGLFEPGIYRDARDAGFTPGAIRDAVTDSDLVLLRAPVGIGSLMAGVPLALGAMQAYRVGLLPAFLGFMGVLIGILFVFPIDSSGILRAFWFSAVAFLLSGKFGAGIPQAWTTGKPVVPEPRQPPAPREKKPKLTK